MSKICSDTDTPCPEPKAGRGRGESLCEQNGICQKFSVSNAPRLRVDANENGSFKLSVTPPEDANHV